MRTSTDCYFQTSIALGAGGKTKKKELDGSLLRVTLLVFLMYERNEQIVQLSSQLLGWFSSFIWHAIRLVIPSYLNIDISDYACNCVKQDSIPLQAFQPHIDHTSN